MIQDIVFYSVLAGLFIGAWLVLTGVTWLIHIVTKHLIN